MMTVLRVALLIALFTVPFDTIRYSVAGIPFVVPEVAAGLVLILFFFTKKSPTPIPRWVWTFFVLLVIGVLTSLLYQAASSDFLSWEVVWHRGLGILKSWFLFPFLFGWVLYQSIDRSDWFYRVVFLGIASVAISVSGAAILSGFVGGYTFDGRLAGVWQSPNFLALFLAPMWPFLLFALCKECSREKKQYIPLLASFLGSALVLLTLLLTRSYGGILAADAAALLFFRWGFPRFFRKYERFVGALLLGGVVFAFSLLLNNPTVREYFSLHSRSSFASRVMIWRASERMLYDSPVFGIGPGNFQDTYLAYQRYFPPYLEWAVPEPHNIFLAFWLQTGLLGLLAFCGLLVLWFRSLIHSRSQNARMESAALLTAMIAILFHGLIDTPYWRTNLAFLFWIVFFLGLSVIGKIEREQEKLVLHKDDE